MSKKTYAACIELLRREVERTFTGRCAIPFGVLQTVIAELSELSGEKNLQLTRTDTSKPANSFTIPQNEAWYPEIGDYKFTYGQTEPFSGSVMSSFYIASWPHCCGYCISGNAYVNIKFRQRGINKLLREFRLTLARYMGYGTVISTNVDLYKDSDTFAKAGWDRVQSFINPRTANEVIMWAYTFNK